ncbi:P-loop_containing nucleoside triphosphate hydrolase [Hexamita inflata]|uniref:P-loop containing nucleoside triphosphate hydrolase n=1 Tax=Hexamita inflata TaxID=28002 RepID=A0AA86N7B1_9EUKA|nr:P-loop containing nucleoside triphosphate hydrolase [Hexamita inflata]CAI9934688.1 P-loop containing nucleoside triphosphate hydrolase [Hexamita inflata]
MRTQINLTIMGSQNSNKNVILQDFVQNYNLNAEPIQQFNILKIIKDIPIMFQINYIETNFEHIDTFKTVMSESNVVIICFDSSQQETVDKVQYYIPLLKMTKQQILIVDTSSSFQQQNVQFVLYVKELLEEFQIQTIEKQNIVEKIVEYNLK